VKGTPSRPIVNSADDRFADPAFAEVSIKTIEITRNEYVSHRGTGTGGKRIKYRPKLYEDLKDTVNTNAMGIAGYTVQALQGKLKGIDAITQYWLGIKYYTVTYTVEVARHLVDNLDQGYRYRDANWVLQDAQVGGVNVVEPVWLDGAGALLVAAAGVFVPNKITFNLYYPADWSVLDLPAGK
jgi:hypothetical protein